jgi:hypothetical protein
MRIKMLLLVGVTISALIPVPLMAGGVKNAQKNAKNVCHAALDAKGLTKGNPDRHAEYEKCIVNPQDYH